MNALLVIWLLILTGWLVKMDRDLNAILDIIERMQDLNDRILSAIEEAAQS